MSGLSVQKTRVNGSRPPVPARPATPAATSAERSAPRQDSLELSSKGQDPQYQSAGEAMADGAAKGAAVGGAIANGAIGTMMIRKALQGGAKLPTTLGGKVMPVIGIGFSVWGMAASGMALKQTLSAEKIEVRPAVAQGLNFVGNALIAGGSVAILTGVGTTPGLVASGAGFVMTAAATLIDP